MTSEENSYHLVVSHNNRIQSWLDKIIPKGFQTLEFYSSLVLKNNTLLEIVPIEFKDSTGKLL